MCTIKRDFLKNLAVWSYGVYGRPIVKCPTWAVQRTHYYTLKFKMAEIRHLEIREIAESQRKIIRF